jgi:hypothetical protein
MVNQKRCKPKGGKSRLSNQDRKDIIQRVKSGEFYKVIANDYSITRDWVYKLAKVAKEAEA